MFYSAGIFRTSSLGGSISSNPERTAPRKWGGQPGYIGVLQQRVDSLNVRRLLLIKEKQISQGKEFSALLWMGGCKSLGSPKSFLWYAPQLSGASILCFHILSQGSPYGVTAVWWLLDGRYSLPSWVPSGLTSSPSAVAAITDVCDILCLLIWQAVFHFSTVWPFLKKLIQQSYFWVYTLNNWKQGFKEILEHSYS